MVSAVLLRWGEIKRVSSKPYFSDPIYMVAKIAIQQIGPESPKVVCSHLQEQFNRLWTESPRPHDDSLRFLALHFGIHFPISRTELGLLFQQPGWEIVCIRIAGLNDALVMMQDLHDRKVQLRVSTIRSFVERGFPKTKAMKWLLQFHTTSKSVELLRQEWESELIASGMTQEEIYKY